MAQLRGESAWRRQTICPIISYAYRFSVSPLERDADSLIIYVHRLWWEDSFRLPRLAIEKSPFMLWVTQASVTNSSHIVWTDVFDSSNNNNSMKHSPPKEENKRRVKAKRKTSCDHSLFLLYLVFLIFPTMLVFVLLMYSLWVQTNKWPKELTPLQLLGRTGLLIISTS